MALEEAAVPLELLPAADALDEPGALADVEPTLDALTAALDDCTTITLDDEDAALEDVVAVLEDVVAALEDVVAALEDVVAALEDLAAEEEDTPTEDEDTPTEDEDALTDDAAPLDDELEEPVAEHTLTALSHVEPGGQSSSVLHFTVSGLQATAWATNATAKIERTPFMTDLPAWRPPKGPRLPQAPAR